MTKGDMWHDFNWNGEAVNIYVGHDMPTTIWIDGPYGSQMLEFGLSAIFQPWKWFRSREWAIRHALNKVTTPRNQAAKATVAAFLEKGGPR